MTISQIVIAVLQLAITGFLSWKVLQVSRKQSEMVEEQNERSKRRTEKPAFTVQESEKLDHVEEADGQVVRLEYENVGDGDAVNPKPVKVAQFPASEGDINADLLTDQMYIENKIKPGETFQIYVDFKEYENLDSFSVIFHTKKRGFFGSSHHKSFMED